MDYHKRKRGEGETAKDEPAENRKDSDDSSETHTSLYGMHDRNINSILRFLKKEVEVLERSRVTPTRKNVKSSLTTAASLIGEPKQRTKNVYFVILFLTQLKIVKQCRCS